MKTKTKTESIEKINRKIAVRRLLRPFTGATPKLEALYLKKSEFYSVTNRKESDSAYKKAVLVHCKYDEKYHVTGANLLFEKGMYADAAELYMTVKMADKAARCYCAAAAWQFFEAMDGYYNRSIKNFGGSQDWWADYEVAGYFGLLLDAIKELRPARANRLVEDLCKIDIFKQSPRDAIKKGISEMLGGMSENTQNIEKHIFEDILRTIESSEKWNTKTE